LSAGSLAELAWGCVAAISSRREIRLASAAASIQRAMSLDPKLAMAHVRMGELDLLSGNRPPSQQQVPRHVRDPSKECRRGLEDGEPFR
jgi:hypothetical protein